MRTDHATASDRYWTAIHGTSLGGAYDRYWKAKNHDEQRAAYLEILLRGGRDGYPTAGELRQRIARILRRLAARIDGFGT